ncbi:MAG TPA: alpha-amylase family glycosyl hydrolase [Longimicrobium sp.]|nr:alpha-amylase family glycosyl hydrolase [Longimicrobium sp.]
MPAPADLLGTHRPESLDAVRALLNQARRDAIEYFPSPLDWRDEVLYFLLPDRFSDGGEGGRPLLTRAEIVALRQAADRPGWSWKQWAESGKRWQGGTINGIRGRLGYLQDLGVTALWVGPVFKQRARLDSYHGYGIQDFLEVDPRFGSRADLQELVRAAHGRGMRIILDIIVNHTGDNWGYVPPNAGPGAAVNQPPYLPWPRFYGAAGDPAGGGWGLAWRNGQQAGFTADPAAITAADDGVWPRELQSERLYSRAGMGDLGAGGIGDPHAEHKRTDFFALKDIALDAAGALEFLAECYKYWIALTDCDGFRIDTVKHMALEETRNFCGAIREFTDAIGKRNYLLVGEIAGGDSLQDFVLDQLAVMQRNLAAALDIGDGRLRLQGVAKGLVDPGEYWREFDEQKQGFESHRAFGNRHVSILDDHDHVFGTKLRFSAEIPDGSPVKDHHAAAATAIQLFTLGIPCIYYGTEQAFAGPAQTQLRFLRDQGWGGGDFADRYLREAMFGPEHPRAHHGQDLATQVAQQDPALPGFGAFGTAGRHCFDPDSPAYVRIASLCRVRRAHPVLRLGRQYGRPTRVFGDAFYIHPAGEMMAWSRILDTEEAVCVINPNGADARGGDVLVAAEICPPGTVFTVVANTAHAAAGGAYQGTHPVGSTLVVKGVSHPGEPAFIEIRDVHPAEVLVLVKKL